VYKVVNSFVTVPVVKIEELEPVTTVVDEEKGSCEVVSHLVVNGDVISVVAGASEELVTVLVVVVPLVDDMGKSSVVFRVEEVVSLVVVSTVLGMPDSFVVSIVGEVM
jgi:hypothetical protein